MVFNLIGLGIKALRGGAAAYNAVKNNQLKNKIVAKYEEIRQTYLKMIECFQSSNPDVRVQGIDYYNKIPVLAREYAELIAQVNDRSVQNQLASALDPIAEHHKKIGDVFRELAEKEKHSKQVSATPPASPKPVDAQPSPAPKPAALPATPTKPTVPATPTTPRSSPASISNPLTGSIPFSASPRGTPQMHRPTTPSSTAEWIDQGRQLLARGDIEKAKTCFQEALSKGASNPDAQLYYGAACFESGDYSEARQMLGSAVQQYKKQLARPFSGLSNAAMEEIKEHVKFAEDMLDKIVDKLKEKEESSSEELEKAAKVQAPVTVSDDGTLNPNPEIKLQAYTRTRPSTIAKSPVNQRPLLNLDIPAATELDSLERQGSVQVNADDLTLDPGQGAVKADNAGYIDEQISNFDITAPNEESISPESRVEPEAEPQVEPEAKLEKAPSIMKEPNFVCTGCGKFYKIPDPDPDLVYACSECGLPVNRVFKCPHCSQHMALPQAQFKQVIGISIPCVYCDKPFTP
ncbi:MAG: tetratricopeptide repeat protein [Candidatus Sigynarchaeota archaeon]